MTFHSEHRPLESYITALSAAGFSVDDIREVTVDDQNDRWAHIPMFLHIAAVRAWLPCRSEMDAAFAIDRGGMSYPVTGEIGEP